MTEIRGAALRLLALLAVTAAVAWIVFHRPPIPQDPAYHRFADTRTFLGISNFQNVVSNLPFLFVGAAGLLRLRRRLQDPGSAGSAELRAAWLFLFLGIFLTGFGSAWYHLRPDNATLVWDRLPMSLAFTAFFAGLVGERISERAYRLLLWPLLGLGVASVLLWRASELRGEGDLRLYVLVQFLPLLMIPLIMALYRPRYTHGKYIFLAFAGYVAAKVLEAFDQPIYNALGGLTSGHALKHLVAAAGLWALVHMFSVRARI
jgi:hypothetical protein